MNYSIFEDNNGAIELSKAPKMRPRTKHIAIKYHFFRDFVEQCKINIFKIDTKNQIADILTKALPRDDFRKLKLLLAIKQNEPQLVRE